MFICVFFTGLTNRHTFDLSAIHSISSGTHYKVNSLKFLETLGHLSHVCHLTRLTNLLIHQILLTMQFILFYFIQMIQICELQ